MTVSGEGSLCIIFCVIFVSFSEREQQQPNQNKLCQVCKTQEWSGGRDYMCKLIDPT